MVELGKTYLITDQAGYSFVFKPTADLGTTYRGKWTPTTAWRHSANAKWARTFVTKSDIASAEVIEKH